MFVAVILFAKPASSNCLPFFLFGYNGKYVHFPEEAKYCVNSKDGVLEIITDEFGGRIINSTKNNGSDVKWFFGESQLFGFDVNGKSGSHDLNNGPFETIEYLRHILQNKTLDHIVVGFNYGTDIFRILPEWNADKVVALDSKDLSFYLNNPFWYEARLAIEILGGKFFTGSRPNVRQLRVLHSKIDGKTRSNRINKFFKELSNLSSQYEISVDFILYPPYWGYIKTKENKFKEHAYTMRQFNDFVCKQLSLIPLIRKVLVAKPREKDKPLFTYDERHFSKDTLDYLEKDNYCVG